MKKGNYLIMADKARELFLDHDCDRIARKFGLRADQRSIYFDFLNQDARLDRADGRIYVKEKDQAEDAYREAGINTTMTVYDMFCYSEASDKIPELTGEFVSVSVLGGIIGSYHQESLRDSGRADVFSGKTEELDHALEVMQGLPAGRSGDVSRILPVFSFFPAWFQFWDADEEFPANYQILFDRNALAFERYETIWYTMGAITDRIQSLMKKPENP